MSVNELPRPLVDYAPWCESTSPIWPLTQLRLRRNISHYPFPDHLKGHERLLIRDVIKDALEKTIGTPPLHIPLDQISALSKTLLSEQLFWNEILSHLHDETSFCMPASLDWQVLINAKDHLTLQRLTTSRNLRTDLSLLLDLERLLGNRLRFAFEGQFGYLTSQMDHCGSGLSAQAFLHLPVLIGSGKLSEMLLNHLPEGISARTLGRNPKRPPGDLLIFFNTHSLGYSENDLLYQLSKTASIFEEAEKNARNLLKQQPTDEWLDRITKAYGILAYSHQLTTREALNYLSYLKLAAHLGWVDGITDGKCNDLFFKMRRSHLSSSSQTETNDKRALLIKKALAPATLSI